MGFRSDAINDHELQLLSFAWETPAFTVREAHDAIREHREISLTAIGTMITKMADKGLLRLVDPRERPHRFAAAVSRDQTCKTFIGGFAEEYFGGLNSKLIVDMLAEMELSTEDRRRILQTIRARTRKD